jgi:transcriptional regulator with XRE-family HTH domain
VRAARGYSGLTAADFAKATGIPVRRLRLLEAGTRQPTDGELHAVAETAGLSIDMLTGDWSAMVPRGTRSPDPDRRRGSSEVEQVGALGVVELKGVGEHFEHAVGDAGCVPAIQAPVVVDADAGQRRHLLAPQSRHLTPAVAAQASLLGRHVGATAGQELRELMRWVHPMNRRRVRFSLGLSQYPPTGALQARGSRQ